MKKVILLLLSPLLLFAPSCTKRTTVPDDELAMIFRDAFLANAYVYDMKTVLDSVQVYQPIFDRYGYSAEDIAYTVGSFSKRKSARLSDVVERSIKMLEQGAALYKVESVILDSIDNIALRFASRVIYDDSLIEFHSLKDTSNLKIVFDSLPAGKYKISFDYLIDSLDNNRSNYRAQTWIQGEDDKKLGLTNSYLRKKTEANYERTLTFDSLTRNVVLMLAESYEVKRTPHITFRDLSVIFIPTAEDAVEQLYRNRLNVKVFADDFFSSLQPTDSLELSTL